MIGETSVRLTDDQYGYIVFGKDSVNDISLGIGNYFAVSADTVISDGGEWNYYHTIIGARHSLIENGELPIEFVNLSKEEIELNYEDWAVEEFNKSKVILSKDIN